MADLQRITGHIEQAANEEAAEIARNAQDKYDEILRAYRARGEQESKDALENARKEAERITERAISAAAQKNAQSLLAYKNQKIGEVIESAKKYVLSMDREEYMRRMQRLLESKVGNPAKAGVVAFNAADLKDIPSGFKAKIAELQLKIADEPADISGGFLLVFGNVEENCSIDALFRENYEKLVDYAGKNLF